MNYPLKHISIRVPWHDTGWDGRVCAAPRLNGACLKLKGIAEKRDDDAEVAGPLGRAAAWQTCGSSGTCSERCILMVTTVLNCPSDYAASHENVA